MQWLSFSMIHYILSPQNMNILLFLNATFHLSTQPSFTGEVRSLPPKVKVTSVIEAAQKQNEVVLRKVNERVDEENPLNINAYGKERAAFFDEVAALAGDPLRLLSNIYPYQHTLLTHPINTPY